MGRDGGVEMMGGGACAVLGPHTPTAIVTSSSSCLLYMHVEAFAFLFRNGFVTWDARVEQEHQDGASAPTARHPSPPSLQILQVMDGANAIHIVHTTPALTGDQILGDYCGCIFELQAIPYCCK